MKEAARAHWRQAESYQKFLYLAGALLIGSAVFHAVVLLVTSGSWQGPRSWRKPILFGEAFGLTAASIAWVMSFLPRRRIVGWLLAAGLGLANVGEVFLVAMQQWRGAASHFNFETPFDQAVFAAMGLLIVVTVFVILIVTLWAMLSVRAASSMGWAIRAGLLILFASQIVGLWTIQNGNARVIDPTTGKFQPQRLETASIHGAAGDLKLLHAVSLHAIQVLPLLAWMLRLTSWGETRRAGAVLAASGGYFLVTGVLTLQALGGRAPLDLSAPAALALGGSAAMLAAPFAAAVAAARHMRRPPLTSST